MYRVGSLALKSPPRVMLGSVVMCFSCGVWLCDKFGDVRGGNSVLIMVASACDQVSIFTECISVVVSLLFRSYCVSAVVFRVL